MNQEEAQARYKELQSKVKVSERTWPIGLAAGLERLTFKNDLNHFRLECADKGISLLEPCPFCGCYELTTMPWGQTYTSVICRNVECAAEGPKLTDPYDAIAAWNKRAS